MLMAERKITKCLRGQTLLTCSVKPSLLLIQALTEASLFLAEQLKIASLLWTIASPGHLRSFLPGIFMALSGDFATFIEVNLLPFYVTLIQSLKFGFFEWSFRATKEAFAHYRMECVCEQEEACLWRCCAFPQVLRNPKNKPFFFVSCFRGVFDMNLSDFRGDDGKLRLGVRRAAQIEGASAFSTQYNMKHNNFAQVAHAISTHSVFSIYYNPK